MARLKLADNAASVLRSRISDTSTTLDVASGTGARFPVLATGDYFKLTIQDQNGNYEIVKVTERTGDTMTVVRAQNGTIAMPFPSDSRVELRILADNIAEYLEQTDFLLL